MIKKYAFQKTSHKVSQKVPSTPVISGILSPNTLFLTMILLLLFFFIRFPEEALDASRQGMQLWLNTLIPTLLPFIILTNVLIKTDFIDKLFRPFHRLWKTLLGLSPQGVYAFFTGILCGYPMGAKITSDLYEHGKVSRREANYLLTFSNNASPAFIINYLYITCLEKQAGLSEILGILFLSTLFCMILFRFLVFHNQTITCTAKRTNKYTSHQKTKDLNISPKESEEFFIQAASVDANNLKKETSTASSFGTIIDVSIMNGFETITRLGGYILLFSLVSAVIKHYNFFPTQIQLLLSGSAELTTGLHQLAGSTMPFPFKYAASVGLTAFGGFSILAQTRSVVSKQLSITPYICAKLLNTLICILLVHITLNY